MTPRDNLDSKSLFLDSRAAYDRWAPDYDGYANPTVAAARIAIEIEFRASAADSVLEYGCGTGENLLFFARQGLETIRGVDASVGMLSIAREKLARYAVEIDQIEANQFDVLRDDRFDLILAVLVLEHIEDLKGFFGFVATGLSEGGKAFVAELHPDQSRRGVRARFRDGEDTEVVTEFYHREIDDYVACAASAGLRALDIKSRVPCNKVIDLEPKAAKYSNEPLLLTMMFGKV